MWNSTKVYQRISWQKRPLPLQSSKHFEPATDQQETKKRKARVSQNTCPDKPEMKNKKVETTEKPGPSTFNRCSSQKEEMKEKRADVSQKTDDTTSETTPSSHQVKDEEMKENIIISFQNIFNNIKMNDTHNTFAVKEIALKFARKIELTCRKIINSNTSGCLTLKLHFVIEVTNGVSPT